MKKIMFKRGVCVLGLLIVSTIAFAQVGPAVPSKDAVPTSNIKDTTDLNLPYQPKDPNVLDSGLIPLTTPEEQKIDWSKVPFVPFKTPELPPAPDPVI